MTDAEQRPAPAVTVGMPVYNDAAFLRQSLDSVLAQTFTDFRLVISDDASTDGSDEICRQYATRDPRVTFIRQPENLGISRNMEFLRDQSTSPYFAWVGDDDVWDPRFLERLYASLGEHPSAAVAFCTYRMIDEQGHAIEEKRDFDYQGSTPLRRLKRLLERSDDAFGYGLIRAEAVRGATFPRWPWPNRDQAYNNIYPSLCHYLTTGDYVHVYGAPLYRKRIKANEAQRHNRRAGSGPWELVRFATRRLYLVGYSYRVIRRAGGPLLATRALPGLVHRWLIVPVLQEVGGALSAKRSSR